MNGHVGARDLVTQDDTSLALSSAGQTTDSTGRASVTQRTIRVKEQVKMSMARKSTKKNGVMGVTNAYSSKLNGSSLQDNSATGNLGRGPTKRLEMSPPPSPEISSPSRFNHSVYQSRVQTSGLGQSQVTGNGKSFHRSTSDPYNLKTPPKLSSAPIGRSIRQTGGAQSRLSSRVSQQTVRTKSVRQTVVKPDQYSENRPNNLRKDYQKPMFLKSYPPSVASSGKLVEAESRVQTTQVQTNGFKKIPEMTLAQAFSYLIRNYDDKQAEATRCIEKEFLQGSGWKKMVFQSEWIEQLLQLLSHDNEEVQCVSAGALRVVVYQDDEKKTEVEQKNGLNIITSALKRSRDKETRRHLTGLLWNLSALDKIKEKFSEMHIKVLTSVVQVSSSGVAENPKDLLVADDEAFYNATGCLRNLSSAGPKIRNTMRNCEKLIDSIVYYVRATVPDCRGDDKLTENCICILQNLSYMVDRSPELSSELSSELSESSSELPSEVKRKAKEPEKTSVGCFPSRSAKEPQEKPLSTPPALSEKANPVGVEWLWSPILIRTYLSLMACKEGRTWEGAVGALQNITAGNKQRSEAIACFIAQKENGLQKIKKILENSESLVSAKTVIQLIRNLSRHKTVQPEIVAHVLKNVVELLPNNDKGDEETSQVAAHLCQILINLTTGDIKHAKAIISLKALTKINNISRIDTGRGPSSAGRAACILLQLMWKRSELHSYIKEVSGLRRKHFINERTNSVFKSETQKQKLSNL
ncbi:Plakophilin-2 [Oryzias melastigma]|uniref:Plakophilin-2 n=1 Tax=Oryzias melastigma TaxID=30732 RepID=A0A834FJU3_ORYME|nr:Plakophilin-2 [Oryzias melastigma]